MNEQIKLCSEVDKTLKLKSTSVLDFYANHFYQERCYIQVSVLSWWVITSSITCAQTPDQTSKKVPDMLAKRLLADPRSLYSFCILVWTALSRFWQL